jgi:hypothetical protein
MPKDKFLAIKIHRKEEEIIRRTSEILEVEKNATRSHLTREANEG